MATMRQRRLKAIAELRELADRVESAAGLFEDTIGDLDHLAPNGVGHANEQGKFPPYEEVVAAANVYKRLLGSDMTAIADTHLNDTEDHDRENCVLCKMLRNETPKGWLSELRRKAMRKEIKAMVADGELTSELTEAAAEQVRHQTRRELYEKLEAAGRLLPVLDFGDGLVDPHHVRTDDEAKAIRVAVAVLNASDAVGAYEENANYHHDEDKRDEMARDFHVAQVDEWEPDEHEPENYEHGTCKVCEREVTRRVERAEAHA